MADEPVDKWRIETNDRYNKIVNSVISLATGALVLPVLFLRQFLGIPTDRALKPLLTCAAYASWFCLGGSVLIGLLYSWLSVKWVKIAWGQKTANPQRCIERVLDVLFVLMMLLFLAGIAESIRFFITVRVVS
ncbi:MAG: hypothetical protein ABSF57_11700 [Acidobacteriaceae bacterium]|jgi:hypothetical protein